MSRLISANFARLWKSRIFWVMEMIMTVFSAAMYVDAYIMIRNAQRTVNNWNIYFFYALMLIGVAMAVLRE